MTKEAVIKFLWQIRTDAALQEKLRAAGNNVENMLKVAADAGYQFTVAEFISATVWDMNSELTDAELEQAAGGGKTRNCYTMDPNDATCAVIGPTQ